MIFTKIRDKLLVKSICTPRASSWRSIAAWCDKAAVYLKTTFVQQFYRWWCGSWSVRNGKL